MGAPAVAVVAAGWPTGPCCWTVGCGGMDVVVDVVSGVVVVVAAAVVAEADLEKGEKSQNVEKRGVRYSDGDRYGISIAIGRSAVSNKN